MNDAKHKPNSQAQREKQRALALAALTQVTYLVESIAQEGKYERQHFELCVDALLDPDYINQRPFSLGNTKARRLFQGHEIKHAKYILSHTATLISLEKRLSKKPEMLSQIATGMERVHKQSNYFGHPYHDSVISSIAHLYGETISTMNPRVIVRGKPVFLRQSQNTDRVRCLLFSGIRAAWVWRTNGGNPFHLLFNRKKLSKQLENMASSS